MHWARVDVAAACGVVKVTAGLQPLHRLWRWLPARQRRALLAHGAAWLAPRAGPRPCGPDRGDEGLGVVIGGEIGRASGLGEGARMLHAALGSMGVPSWLIDAGLAVPGEQADETPPAQMLADLPPRAPLVLCVNAPQLPLALLRLPRARLRGRLVIGFWSWELPVLPSQWRPGLGLVHEIWVPSAFTAAAVTRMLELDSFGLKPSGSSRRCLRGRFTSEVGSASDDRTPADVRAPVLRTVPYPLAVVPPRPAAMGRDAFGLPAEAVIVLVSFSLASSFARKNPLGAIAAFRAAFGDRPDRILVLKIGKTAHHADDLATIQAACGGAGNIRIETRTLPSAERHALTACVDIVLSLHRSEGFGLVPAEAMLLGKPVVATGWSGNLAFMDAASAALVKYRLVAAIDPRGVYDVPDALWAEPDIGNAAARLRQLAGDAPARAALGALGQAAARARLGPGPLADAMRAIDVAGDAKAAD